MATDTFTQIEQYTNQLADFHHALREYEYHQEQVVKWLDGLRHRIVTVSVTPYKISKHDVRDPNFRTHYSRSQLTGLVMGWYEVRGTKIHHYLELIYPKDDMYIYHVPLDDVQSIELRPDLEF